jgi:hypothetical protein
MLFAQAASTGIRLQDVNNKFHLVSKPQSTSSFYTVRVSAVLIDESVSKATTSSMNLPI